MNLILHSILILIISFSALHKCEKHNDNNAMLSSTLKTSSTLLKAVEDRDAQLVLKLLKLKPDLEYANNQRRTPLMIATYNDDAKIAEMLILAGANVNAQDEMLNSPFLYAGASGYVEILKMCLANGADFKIFNRYGGSALIPAAEKRHVEIVQILSTTPNFPINHINNLGWTALLEAIILGSEGEKQIDIIKILINAGCDFTIADFDGITPLQHAKKRSMHEIAAILTQAGARK